jgi:hypothetical protein
MRERRGPDQDPIARRPAESAEPAAPEGSRETLLRLQRQAGNVATRAWLAGPAPVQRQAGGGAPAAPPVPAAVAHANADAARTQQRVTAVLQEMLRSRNPSARNTAQLYTGSSPRLTWTPMTRRSDSATMASLFGTVGTAEYFFTGVNQPPWTPGPLPAGTMVFAPGVGGTIQGNTALIRGQYPSGDDMPDRQLMSTFVHETSHTLVASYGQHPGTTVNAASFDRYKDEFRAYYVDPYDTRFADLEPDRRATAIRTLLVGRSATNPNPATHAYSQLQAVYWTNAAFRAQVNAHTRPDGFNLTNSPRLDRLFTALSNAAGDPSRVDDLVIAVTRLPAAERAEAATSSLIRTLSQAVGAAADRRIRRALEAPTRPDYADALNPGHSARVTGFYDSLVRGDPAGIKAAYGRLDAGERGGLRLNAAALVFIDRHVESIRVRACVVAMVNTGLVGQFDAVDAFIGACLRELADELLNNTTPTAPSPQLIAAVRAMTFEARIGFYRLSEEARVQYVEVLPPPVLRPLIAILRGERDP